MSRSPRGARPYRRVIVVDTLVSSMNTSLLGSSLFCRLCNALRAAATSGRSCSAARKLFFKGQLQMMQKPGDRRLSDRDLFLRQSIFEFGQRDVRLLSYQLPHQILMRRQREIFVAAEFGRLDAARLPVKLEEADDRTDADAALLRSFRDGGPALNRPDHSPTQILRIRLRHACWPPPSRHLESCSCRYGNPRVSLLGKRSNRRCQRMPTATKRRRMVNAASSDPGAMRRRHVGRMRCRQGSHEIGTPSVTLRRFLIICLSQFFVSRHRSERWPPRLPWCSQYPSAGTGCEPGYGV